MPKGPRGTAGAPPAAAAPAMEETFGPLSLTMLFDTPLVHIWRVAFLANTFTGPLYRVVGERFGLTRPQFVILFCLSQGGPVAAKDICLATGLPKNSISRAVSELLSRGLIARQTEDKDKRKKTLALTQEGRALLEEVVPLFSARQSAMRAGLSADEAEQFDSLLGKLVMAMPGWPQPG
ncbi:MAG: MarR family transcriptional regulator [Pseudomonadota bacterium]